MMHDLWSSKMTSIPCEVQGTYARVRGHLKSKVGIKTRSMGILCLEHTQHTLVLEHSECVL